MESSGKANVYINSFQWISQRKHTERLCLAIQRLEQPQVFQIAGLILPHLISLKSF